MLPEIIILGVDPGTNYMGYGLLGVTGNKARFITHDVIDLHKISDPYLSLSRIFTEITSVIETYLPDEMAIEAPFFGKNVQSMLKLGRAQGVAITAAIQRQIPITEYAPMKIKMAITGNGSASKEQVADMLQRLLRIPESQMPIHLDATDALAAAYCHFLQRSRPESPAKHYSSWKDYVDKNRDKVKK